MSTSSLTVVSIFGIPRPSYWLRPKGPSNPSANRLAHNYGHLCGCGAASQRVIVAETVGIAIPGDAPWLSPVSSEAGSDALCADGTSWMAYPTSTTRAPTTPLTRISRPAAPLAQLVQARIPTSERFGQ